MSESDLNANKTLVKNYLQAMSQMDMDKAASMMHSAFEAQIPNITVRPNAYNKAEMLAFVGGLKAALPNGIRFEFRQMIAEKNSVSSMVDGFATTIDGTAYNNRYHFSHNIEEGKIIEHWEYIDSYLAAKVMGPIIKRLSEQNQ